jgi:hypothetical protein
VNYTVLVYDKKNGDGRDAPRDAPDAVSLRPEIELYLSAKE